MPESNPVTIQNLEGSLNNSVIVHVSTPEGLCTYEGTLTIVNFPSYINVFEEPASHHSFPFVGRGSGIAAVEMDGVQVYSNERIPNPYPQIAPLSDGSHWEAVNDMRQTMFGPGHDIK